MAPSFADHRLPPGRHGIAPEKVRESQRLRLLGACSELIAEMGYSALTVASICRTAAVSKAVFYRQFEGLPECVLATYEMAADNAMAATRSACSAGRQSTTVPAAVGAVLELLAAEPALAHVLTEQALDELPAVARSRAEFANQLAALLTSAGQSVPAAAAGPPSLAGLLVQASAAWISTRLAVATPASLPRSAPELARLLTYPGPSP